jgi:hypothetical protein
MLSDKPRRICSEFIGDKRRRAVVYQDLVTRQYIVERTHEGITPGFNNVYDNLQDAEDSAEDWVLPQ